VRCVRRFFVLSAMLAVSACGWAQFPSTRSGPIPLNQPRSADAFINATAVRVGRGDTVYSIARRHKLSPRVVIDANHLRPPYALRVGQRLVLPQGRIHTVRRGEFLALIGNRYGVDAFSIARINAIRAPYTIFPGQKLRIPRTVGFRRRQIAKAPRIVARQAPPKRRRATAKIRSSARAKVQRPPARAGGKFAWPLKGRVISKYGPKKKGLYNDGINIAAPRGAPVKAVENGVVAYAGNEIRGFGNLLLIKHDGGWVSAYAHNDRLLVKRGEKVMRGQVISQVGSTGSVTSPQLHFELRKGSNAVDPGKYMM